MNLLTRRAGEAHFTSQQFRSMVEVLMGTESYVAKLYEELEAELAENNTIKIRSGMLIHHGGIYLVPEGTYDEVTYQNGSQGMQRIDLIVARYTKNAETGVETGEWVVIPGESVEADPVAPEYTAGNMQDGDLIDECPVFAVHFDGLNVTAIDKLVNVVKTLISEDVVDSLDSTETEKVLSAKQGYLLNKYGLSFKRTLSAGEDMNDIVEPGIYAWLSSDACPANSPTTYLSILEVFGTLSGSSQKIQRVTRYGGSGYSWFRTLYSNGWTDWVKIVVESDLDSYLKLTGGTLTGALKGTSAEFSGSGTFSQMEVLGTSSTGAYVDFHLKGDTENSFNMRIQNSGDGVLSFGSGSQKYGYIRQDAAEGYLYPASGSEHYALGDSDHRWTTLYTANTVNVSSLLELKENIRPFTSALDEIDKTDVFNYNLKSCIARYGEDIDHTGFIIGEGYNLSELLLGHEKDGIDMYNAIGLTFGGVKELYELVKLQQKEINELKDKIAEMQS